MEPKEKKAFEPSGLVPRSIVRTFERFRQQLLPGSETAAIREYRISRYQVLVSARCLFTLLIIPIATNWLVSSWLLSPLVEHFWNTQQNEIFLNSYQEERAFAELESFSEKLFFESLLNTTNTINVDFTLSSCDRNSIPHTPEGVRGKCYDKNFSSSSQSSAPNKFTSVTPLQSFALQPLEVHFSGGYAKQDKPSICKIWDRIHFSGAINDVVLKSVPIDDYVNCLQMMTRLKSGNDLQAVPAFYKSSICAARINSPFNKFRKTWYSSIFHPIKTSIALEELVQRERNSLSLQRANSFQPSTPCTVHSSGGYGVEFIQYEKYLPLPSWEKKKELTSYDNSLTQPLLTSHPKLSYASSSVGSSATLVPLKFHANDDQTLVWLPFARDQQLKNFLPATRSKKAPLPVQVHFSGGYIEEIPLGGKQAVRVNNGVKAWGTAAKTPFLLSVPIESTYDNSLKIKEKVQNKILELAIYYNKQTIISITNIVGDVVSLVTLGCLFIWMKPEITILKSFLIEAIYSLSDTTKSFLLILLTDLLVGFHSPRGWETALELLLKHFGLPENQDFVFLFVATFPVLLDTVFKYWIFRHLNKISPSTVATYHSMIE